MFRTHPEKFEGNIKSTELINRLEKMDEFEFDINLIEPLKTMITILK